MYEGMTACEWLPPCVCDCLHRRAGCGLEVDASKGPICVFQVHVHKRLGACAASVHVQLLSAHVWV